MSTEENKALVRRVIDELNKGNLDAFDDVCASDFAYHEPPNVEFRSLEAFKEYLSAIYAAYPDLQMSLEHMIAEGDTVAYRYTSRGTHSGRSPAFGVGPTGKQVEFPAMAYSRVSDGKVAEMWHHPDNLGLLQQMGVIPPLGEG